jgi:hypothetical protein
MIAPMRFRTRAARRAVIALLVPMACVAPSVAQAQAQTQAQAQGQARARAVGDTQGQVLVDGAVIWRSDASVVATTARAATLLDVTARSDNWYEVIIPESLGGRGERGLIAVSQLRILEGSPQPPTLPLRGSRPVVQNQEPTRPRSPSRPTRSPGVGGFLSANRGHRTTVNNFSDGAAFRENAEEGRFDTAYSVKAGPTIDVAGGVTVGRSTGVGVAVERFKRSTPVVLSGSVPHPFFFSRPRAVSADVGGLTREELAIHVQLRGVVPIGNRFQVSLFGGPSFFRLTQDVVTDFAYTDDYPYDAASFERASATRSKASKPGFNGGGDVAFFFTRQIGVGVSAQFSRATVKLPSADDGTRDARVGGVQVGGGLRLRF